MKTDDDISQMPMWKSYLYHLQQQAPKPKRIPCQKDIPNKPPYYGREYHGPISREDADFMLTIGGEGSYLIRESQRAPGQYTLAIRFDGVTKNFKLYFDNQHYVGEKRFDNINDLVADGLITFYLESKAADYIASLSNQSNYAESPYVAYNTHKKHQQAAPKRPPRGTQAVPAKRHDPPDPQQQQSSAIEPRFISPRPSSDVASAASTGDSSASSSGGAGRPNIPIERTRLSQIAEQRRSQDLQKLKHHGEEAQKSLHQNQVPVTPSGKPLPPTPGSNRQTSAPRGIPVPQVDTARVTSSTNTEGPMLEDQQFLTPPSSPPSQTSGLSMVDAPSSSKQTNSKLSSVTWCTDYFEVISCEKPHNFKLYTFKGPHWCDYCANFLWGLIAQGVKCQDCGFNAHKKCSEKVPNDCMPDMKYVKRVFGIDLTTLVKAQSTLIPAVVEMCVKEIESRAGLDSEGLYRVAGFHDDVEAIRMSFDKDGELTDISEERYDDLNTIASVLKLYFRLLPIPLVTFDVYFKVIDIVRREDLSGSQKLELIKHSIEQLPPAHYHTLKYLVSHLHRVTEHQQQNMMNAENLAIVFAPTLLRSPETDPLFSLSAVKYERELIELLIINHSVLFI